VRAAGDSHHSGELAAGEGRIERNHGTHQDRLVKKLRRQGVADLATANAFLESAYWAEHNQRFARPAVAPDDFHVALPKAVRLEAVFRLEEQRTVSNDWVVRYANRYFQLDRQSQRPPARSTVEVYEAADGQIEIRYRGRGMRYEERSAATVRQQRAAARPADLAAAPPAPPARRRGQSADHPWRHQVVADHYLHRRMAKDRRAWERGQP
jgi:hypothetical protein